MTETTSPSTSPSTKPASTVRTIEMKDGRKVNFGATSKLSKDYTIDAEKGVILVTIDFEDGRSIKVPMDMKSPLILNAAAHGLVQKLGDAAAGAESVNDAFEGIIEVATRIVGDPKNGKPGVWNKTREGGGSAKGAGELVEAMVIVLSKGKKEPLSIDAVREMLASLDASDKAALRKTKDVAEAIEQVRKAKGPSKAEKEKAAAAEGLLKSLQAGKVPEKAAPAPVAEPASM